MLSTDQFMDIALLHREGRSLREIAALTGHSRNTIRRVVREKAPSAFHPPPRPSRLDPFKDYLRGRFLAHGLSAVRLFAEVRSMGFTGSEVIVRRFIQSLRDSAAAKLTVRFETPPGEQAQADWAEVGRFTLPGGEPVRLYAFVMVLSFSRMLYVEFTRSMRVETLIRCHQNAFAAFGGWPRQILYDNLRQVAAGPERISPRFRDFADHHGFAVRRHRPYRPRTKGKVERMVAYVKDNFLNARVFCSPFLIGKGAPWSMPPTVWPVSVLSRWVTSRAAPPVRSWRTLPQGPGSSKPLIPCRCPGSRIFPLPSPARLSSSLGMRWRSKNHCMT